MSKFSLDGLVIRTAVVVRPDFGYIYACDPKKEAQNIPHTIIFRWLDGVFEKGECNYNAHTACIINDPELGVVDVSEAGYYTANTKNGLTTNDIFQIENPPKNNIQRHGGIRAVTEISGKAHAIGIRGILYRLDEISQWKRIDMGLPESFNGQSVDGFGLSDIYAVGRRGEMWYFDGKRWAKIELPTNKNLTSIKCAGDGVVYVAGYGGILLRGRGHEWEVIHHEETDEDIWDLEYFNGGVYLSTMSDVYLLKNEKLKGVAFGKDSPKSCYQLSSCKDVLWSNGEYDVMSFDGEKWTRII